MKKLSRFKLCGEVDTTIAGKLLYLVLDELSDDNGVVIISQRKISDALRISKRTVSRNLRLLEYSGHIDIEPQYHSDGGRAASKYIINEG